MITLRGAAQQALEAMEKATRFMSDSDYKKLNQAIEDLRAALAAPTVPSDCPPNSRQLKQTHETE